MSKVTVSIFGMIMIGALTACSSNSSNSLSTSNDQVASIEAESLTLHSLQDYQNLCSQISTLNSVALPAGGSSTQNTDTLVATVTSYGTLSVNSSSVFLSGTPNASPRDGIQEIDDQYGTVIVCNLDISTLQLGNATVIVIGGNVGSLTHGNGTLIMAGGTITGSITTTGNGPINYVNQ